MNYLLYGLSWALPYSSSVLPVMKKSADVDVVFGKVDESTIDWHLIGVCYKAAPGAYFLNVPGVARFLLSDGNKIVIEMLADVEIPEIEHFLYSLVAGALLMQRGILPLRASVVEREGKAVVLMGAAAAGKSLLAAGLMRKGYRVVTDHVCAVFPGNEPVIKAGPAGLLLWRAALQELGYDPAILSKPRQNIERYLLPISDENYALEAAADSLFCFSRDYENRYREVTVTGHKKFMFLLEYIYHNPLIDAFRVKQQLYPTITSLIKHAALTEIRSTMLLRDVNGFIEAFTGRHWV